MDEMAELKLALAHALLEENMMSVESASERLQMALDKSEDDAVRERTSGADAERLLKHPRVVAALQRIAEMEVS